MSLKTLKSLLEPLLEGAIIKKIIGDPPNEREITYVPWHILPARFWVIKFIAKGQRLYWFNGLYYEFVPAEAFRDMINDLLKDKKIEAKNAYSIPKASEIYNQIIDHVQLPPEKVLDEEMVVPFQNGFLTQDGFYPAGSNFYFDDYYITKIIPHNFRDGAIPESFLYMLDVLIPDKKLQRKICIFLAYTMIPMKNNLRYHQIWYGGGNNGKTQLAEHWGDLLGELTSRIALNSLLSDTHAMVGLRGKTLNISSEIKGVMLGITALDRFKSMLTDPYISCRDVFESQLLAQYPNNARLLGTANDLPYSEFMEDDRALFSRFELIPIVYQWNDADWEQFRDADGTCKHVFDKIFTTEADAILSYIASFRFYFNELTVNWEHTQKEWISAGNSAIAFMHCAGISDDRDSEKRDLYNTYTEWCKKRDRKKLNYQQFYKTLKHRGYIEITRRNEDGVTERLIEAFSYSENREQRALTEFIIKNIE